MNGAEDPLERVVRAYPSVFAGVCALIEGSRVHRAPRGTVLLYSGLPVPLYNALVSPLREPDPEETAAAAAYLRTKGVPWSMHVRGAPDARTARLAARHGLAESARQPLMVAATGRVRPRPRDAALRVRPAGADDLGAWVDTVAAGFEAPREVFAPYGHPCVPRVPGMTPYLAELDGVPVGAGLLTVSGGLAGVFCVATLPAHRGRGVGRAVTEDLVRAGRAAGAATAYLYASPMGEPLYASMGFRTREHLTLLTTA